MYALPSQVSRFYLRMQAFEPKSAFLIYGFKLSYKDGGGARAKRERERDIDRGKRRLGSNSHVLWKNHAHREELPALRSDPPPN